MSIEREARGRTWLREKREERKKEERREKKEELRDQKSEVRSQKSEIGNRKSEPERDHFNQLRNSHTDTIRYNTCDTIHPIHPIHTILSISSYPIHTPLYRHMLLSSTLPPTFISTHQQYSGGKIPPFSSIFLILSYPVLSHRHHITSHLSIDRHLSLSSPSHPLPLSLSL